MKKAGWKARFGLSGAIICSSFAASSVNAEISISRDAYGVPDIQASTNKEMFFAFGYAMARDRVLQITKLKFLSSGILINDPNQSSRSIKQAQEYANYFLHEYPNLDSQIATEISELKREKSSKNVLAITALDCIAGGISQFLKDMETKTDRQDTIGHKCYLGKPNKKQGEFLSFGQSMSSRDYDEINRRYKNNGPMFFSSWTAEDVLKVFMNRMMDKFSNRNEEINSFAFLRLLENANSKNPERARRIFNSFKWVADPEAITEIPLADNANEESARAKMARYRSHFHRSFVEEGSGGVCPVINNPQDYNAKASGTISQQMAHLDGFPQSASNFWAITGEYTPKNISSVFMDGPQISTTDPSGFYPFKMESGEGFQYTGSTFAGTLFPFMGRNDRLAYGWTAGNADVSDIFCIPVTRSKRGDGYEGAGLKLVSNPALKARGIPSYYVENKNWSVSFLDSKPNSDKAVAYIKRVAWQGTTAKSFASFLAASQEKISMDGIGHWMKRGQT